ncbi:hypothetical protein WJX73_000176 [Symbiochloris irregularis]|uniref:NAD(P)-binding domain-containing protein n=1 Tax=Symbiochloris irregularis TaxID=706552 RepID=A0AAW1P1I8_9CHLO
MHAGRASFRSSDPSAHQHNPQRTTPQCYHHQPVAQVQCDKFRRRTLSQAAQRAVTQGSRAQHSTRHTARHRCVLVMASATGAAGSPLKVLVTGAGGKTGKLVLKMLLAQPDRYKATALVHSQQSAEQVQQDSGLQQNEGLFVADIAADAQGIAKALQGADALIIATSATPKMEPDYKPGEGPPRMFFPQMPEQVDWIGQKNQIDAAVQAGVKKIVLVSSMGGTDPSNMLNRIGGGKILLYKRKAEEYLMQQQGVQYTIIHPGGLIDEAGGEREIIVGVDDELMTRDNRSIPRADVAELCVQCLQLEEASNRSFDVVSKPPPGSTDYRTLLTNMTRNCNYSLGESA